MPSSKLNQDTAPLLERLNAFALRQHVRLHVPGHKGLGWNQETALVRMIHESQAIDFTEISGLDDLHDPNGVIQEAESLAAQCFGADRSFFLVNGSTVGNTAMILAVCEPGDVLIVQRN